MIEYFRDTGVVARRNSDAEFQIKPPMNLGAHLIAPHAGGTGEHHHHHHHHHHGHGEGTGSGPHGGGGGGAGSRRGSTKDFRRGSTTKHHHHHHHHHKGHDERTEIPPPTEEVVNEEDEISRF